MTDAQVRHYLSENGYPQHVVREGRAGLLRRWREFVEQVERGYSLGIEDYRNDLDVRGIIALAKADDAEVHALDERLQELLTATDKCAFGRAARTMPSGTSAIRAMRARIFWTICAERSYCSR